MSISKTIIGKSFSLHKVKAVISITFKFLDIASPNEILSNYDLIIIPTTPTTAFKLGEKTSDPVQMYLADIFTVQAPLAGLPAISVPETTHSNGLSIGIQVIGKRVEEQEMLDFAQYLTQNH